MELELYTPAVYRIQVKGYLDECWSGRLGGMSIQVAQSGGTQKVTLVGRLSDQAALLGVLNTLYSLHLPLLSVELEEAFSVENVKHAPKDVPQGL